MLKPIHRSFLLGFLLGAGVALVGTVIFRPGRIGPPVAVRPPEKIPAVARFQVSKGTGKIALVIDDWGYSLHQVPTLASIRGPLTVAVLPNLPYSEEVAQAARSRGHEVILHLPMEAQDPTEPTEARTIATGMPKSEVIRHLATALDSVPYAKGISNHQGSKATESTLLMEALLTEAKRRRLYFLDSLTTPDSVGQEVARSLGLRFAKRTLFLDNEEDPQAIRRQLTELAIRADRDGFAIGVGHDRPLTMALLKEAVRAFKRAGYDLVAASELAKEVP